MTGAVDETSTNIKTIRGGTKLLAFYNKSAEQNSVEREKKIAKGRAVAQILRHVKFHRIIDIYVCGGGGGGGGNVYLIYFFNIICVRIQLIFSF